MIKEYNCIICDKPTISPRAHITTHSIDEIADTFTRLTVMPKTIPLLSNKEEHNVESYQKPPKQKTEKEKFADLTKFVRP